MDAATFRDLCPVSIYNQEIDGTLCNHIATQGTHGNFFFL